MPELPEVETVRRGLAEAVTGSQIVGLRVRHPRAVRRQPGGAREFVARCTGRGIAAVNRRGKYLWLTLRESDGADGALVAHLGMSGQFRISDRKRVVDPHVRVVLRLADGRALLFRDQRTFGWVLAADTDDEGTPDPVAHIALDPFDPGYDARSAAARMAASQSGIKRLLLAQTMVSGVGNIYADEALWRAAVHPDTSGRQLEESGCLVVLQHAAAVMSDALAAGGTSFDPLYVAVNGESGWFSRSLDAYGRAGEACRRCGAIIIRERFTNRSSHRCPECQPPGQGAGGSLSVVKVAQ